MRKNFRFTGNDYEPAAKAMQEIAGKNIKEKDSGHEQEMVKEKLEVNVQDEEAIEYAADEPIDYSTLPAKLPGPLRVIDEDVLLFIILIILLQSPRKDFSLILIILLLIIN